VRDKKIVRCEWAEGDSLYQKYHDEEWGISVHDDKVHFEFLVLEGAQAGLSWLTILKRREGYRIVFKGFDVHKVAKFTELDIQEALKDKRIIRNKLKVRSAVNNAIVFVKIQQEFGSFDKYIWSFVNNLVVQNHPQNQDEVPANTELSDKISKDLKSRGMSFVGSTIIYAYLQATGLVNDHAVYCFLCKV